MKYNPQLFGILMQPAMSTAILDDRKRVTRRMLNPQPLSLEYLEAPRSVPEAVKFLRKIVKSGYRQVYTRGILKGMAGPKCRYGRPGDILYVKETWSVIGPDTGPDFVVPTDMPHIHHIESGFDQLVVHKAGKEKFDWTKYGGAPKWRSSLFMPATGARSFLEIESIEPQRLHDMTEDDAKLEGVEPFTSNEYRSELWRNYVDPLRPVTTALESFATLWESINGPGTYITQNPFVWAIHFKIISRHDKKVIALLSDFITRAACPGPIVPY